MAFADPTLLPILTDGDPRLRAVALPVATIDHEVRSAVAALAACLAAYRAANGFGRGIAAPQLGIARRIVVLDLGAGPIALIDPEITWRDPDTFLVWDDCFSLPGRLVRVRRHRSVSVAYRDLAGRARLWERLPPDLAELVQHELDHLDGVLMSDRAEGADAVRDMAQRAALVDAARPQPRLSLERIAAAAREIDAVFRDSPQYDCEPLSATLGCALRLKLELLNPIRSFKGRGADWFLSQRLARGEHGALVCASAGNFGQALAYVCSKHRVALTVFAALHANPLKIERMRALGADVHLHGADFDAAKAAARAHATKSGDTLVEDGLDAAISEGAGSIAVELLRDDPALDLLVVPLGNGALLNGMARWCKARSPATRVIGVVSRGAPAMALSWRAGRGASPISSERVDTIADGIAVRVPIAQAVADMHGCVDDVVEVDDAHLIDAMRLIHRHVGVVLEPAGAAGIAAILAAPQNFDGRRVASVLCGGNVTPQQIPTFLSEHQGESA
jgi:peptide deformylase